LNTILCIFHWHTERKGPGFNPRLRQGFLCLIFCIVVVVFLLFFSKNTLYIAKYCNSFNNVNLFSILNVLQDLWPIIRVKRYRPSIFKYQNIHNYFFTLKGRCSQSLANLFFTTWQAIPFKRKFYIILCLYRKVPLLTLCRITYQPIIDAVQTVLSVKINSAGWIWHLSTSNLVIAIF